LSKLTSWRRQDPVDGGFQTQNHDETPTKHVTTYELGRSTP